MDVVVHDKGEKFKGCMQKLFVQTIKNEMRHHMFGIGFGAAASQMRGFYPRAGRHCVQSRLLRVHPGQLRHGREIILQALANSELFIHTKSSLYRILIR